MPLPKVRQLFQQRIAEFEPDDFTSDFSLGALAPFSRGDFTDDFDNSFEKGQPMRTIPPLR